MGMSKSRGGLGFRDKPNALVSRLFKARYYPECHLLQANRIGGSNYTWSDIFEAKEEIKKGLRWVLGDGQTIRINHDRWLRNKESLCVDQVITSTNTRQKWKVCEFFTTDKKNWDVPKVKFYFNQEDAEVIINTRIPQRCTKTGLPGFILIRDSIR